MLDFDLDVDFTQPCGAKAAKGNTVRILKRTMSWVQNDASQFGFYLIR